MPFPYYLFPQAACLHTPRHPSMPAPSSLAKITKVSLYFFFIFFNLLTLPLTLVASSGFADISQIWQSLNHGNHLGKWD